MLTPSDGHVWRVRSESDQKMNTAEVLRPGRREPLVCHDHVDTGRYFKLVLKEMGR